MSNSAFMFQMLPYRNKYIKKYLYLMLSWASQLVTDSNKYINIHSMAQYVKEEPPDP